MKIKQLSLFQRIIFVDWHGVLSSDPFWTSILDNNTHPLHPQLKTNLNSIFSCKSTMHDWMKGKLSSEDIVSRIKLTMDKRFKPNFLVRRLNYDCARMRVNVDLLKVICKISPLVPIVLATDNMDCFFQTFEHSRARKRNGMPQVNSMADWANICDDIICSSNVGTLKAEDPIGFFGPILSNYCLKFSDALLIDDRADNCEAFRQNGGNAIQWKLGISEINQVSEAVRLWLSKPSKPA